MRSLLYVVGALVVLMLVVAGPVEAKGGKGGGGGGGRGGKPSFGGGGKPSHGGGGKQSFSGGSTHKKSQWSSPQPSHGGQHEHFADRPQKAAKEKPSKYGDLSGGSTDSGGETTPYNKKQKQLQLAQQQRDKKLAQAEHLRQIAERNGNANLAANADRMEAQALSEYERKAAHWEKFGVTDPALNPELPVDPLPPIEDPLLNDPLLEEPLGILDGLFQ